MLDCITYEEKVWSEKIIWKPSFPVSDVLRGCIPQIIVSFILNISCRVKEKRQAVITCLISEFPLYLQPALPHQHL